MIAAVLCTAAATALISPVPLQPTQAAIAVRNRAPSIRSVATTPSLASAPRDQAVAPVGKDAWAAQLDYPAFRKEVHALGKRLADEQNEDDVRHLRKMIAWSNTFGFVGMATMWMSSPLGRLISVVGLSTWTCTRWTMIGHHISHGGFNRVDDPSNGGTGRYTSRQFATGTVWRRVRDWFDWMLPEAWNVEHNTLHHYRLSESGDPDLVERNLEIMRKFPLPGNLKYVGVAFLAAMWKWYYYAPNTYKQLKISRMRKAGLTVSEADAHEAFTLVTALFDKDEAKKYDTGPLDFMRSVMGPYLFIRFFLMPAPLLLFSRAFYWAAVINLALSDILSNIHSFIIIATNHCGDDMYKFDNSCKPRSGTFFMRAITSSANFRTSNGIDKNGKARKIHGHRADMNDFLHGWLNYQIEHHAFPQLSMLAYQKAAPQLRAICDKYGVPYVQQNVFRRLKKTADIMVGKTDMRPFDASWEYEPDRFTWADQNQLERQLLKDQLKGTASSKAAAA